TPETIRITPHGTLPTASLSEQQRAMMSSAAAANAETPGSTLKKTTPMIQTVSTIVVIQWMPENGSGAACGSSVRPALTSLSPPKRTYAATATTTCATKFARNTLSS